MAADLEARSGSGVSAGHSEIGRENRALRDLVALYRHLSGLALQNADIATVTRLIAERTGATAAVVGPRMDVLAAAFPTPRGQSSTLSGQSSIPSGRPPDSSGQSSESSGRPSDSTGQPSDSTGHPSDSTGQSPAPSGQHSASIGQRTDTPLSVGGRGVEESSIGAGDSGVDRAAADYVAENVVHPRLAQVLGASGLARRALRLPDAATGSSVVVAPILVGDDVPAYLITLDGDAGEGAGEDLSLLLTEHAATICGVILGRERIVTAAAGRARDDLVEGLLSSRGHDTAEISRWAAHLGYDPARDHRVISVALDAHPLTHPPHPSDPRPTEAARPTGGPRPAQGARAPEGMRSAEGTRVPEEARPSEGGRPAEGMRPTEDARPGEGALPADEAAGGEGARTGEPGRASEGRGVEGVVRRAAETMEHLLTAHAPDAIVSIREGEVVAVLTEPEARAGTPAPPGPQRLGELCLDRLAALFPGVPAVVGIGGRCRDPAELSRSYEEARRAVETLRRVGRHGRVVPFDALGIHRLLLQVPDLESLRVFAREVFGPRGGDAERTAPYLTTLACYFHENNSPRRAAGRLHVHPNTVTYRVRRVEEITGLDFARYRDRLMAQVALEILDALGDLETLRETP
ncbi:MAG: hypothetical protein GEV11_04735 [Streptosporangiales bacterium]|nr:hypothetical protein [Streptosporangiales bacterium]